MTRMADSGSWWGRAACQTVNTELFFPVTEAGPGLLQVARAKAVCADCRVRRECLEYALDTHQAHGIWGGLSERDRHRLQTERSARAVGRAS
jgi:WhiB family redox-sensing transcriptional regulator